MKATGSVTTFLCFLVPLGASAQETPSDPVRFVRDVLPILNHSCVKCHGPEKQKGGLRLDQREAGLRGGNSGKAIVPGNSAASRLIQFLLVEDRDERMPRNDEPLTRERIEILRRWIDQGAVWPDEIPDPRAEPHWGWKRPLRAALPAVRNTAWGRTSLDAFIAAGLEKKGLPLPPPAPKHRLLRRVTLDLVGLPPTRDELRAFLADDAPDAYEKVVDRLLESPKYGERWGRHWMDVWRYSDWYGRRKEVDMWNSWSTIWRWRDWIVRSLNEDKGYDRMVVEMLAADEVAPEDDATVVATGFIVRNWFQQNYYRWKRDLVEHAGKAFLGLTFNCALCHDHKYDPISQEDYFRFTAFFEPLELRQDRLPGEPDPGPFAKQVKGGTRKPIRSGMIRVFDQTLDPETFIYVMGDDRQRADRPPVAPGVPAFLGGSKPAIEPVALPPAASYPGLKRFVREEELARHEKSLAEAATQERRAAAEAELQALRARIASDDARYGNAPEAAALAQEASRLERRVTVLLAREKLAAERRELAKAREKAESAAGDAKAKAALEQAEKACAAAEGSVQTAEGALEKTSAEYAPLGPLYPAKSTGRRSALARWITSRENPLAARVAVNHLWLRHFGHPLVESVSEFGRAGTKPTHPELLDWLAVDFMESGWKMKRLHRLVVTSSAYRADSAGGDEGARFPSRRVEAEVVRDSVLHLAGRLDLTMGGPEIEGREKADARRRAMYFSIYPEDGGTHPFLELFDPADACDCYRRSTSVVPQQALALTNSELFVELSRVVAQNLREEVGETGFVTAAFEHVLSRPPTGAEAARCREFLEQQVELYRREEPAGQDPVRRAGESLVRVLFNHHDFVTIR